MTHQKERPVYFVDYDHIDETFSVMVTTEYGEDWVGSFDSRSMAGTMCDLLNDVMMRAWRDL